MTEPNFLERPAPGAVPVLAIDVGTSMGWALRTAAGVTSGRENWTERRGETRGDRLRRFRRWLSAMHAATPLAMVAYELVRGHGPGQLLAAHCYGQFEGVLLEWCARNAVPARCVHTATLKKAVTGSGNARKDRVGAAVRAAGFRPETHDEADAIAVLLWVTGAAGEAERAAA